MNKISKYIDWIINLYIEEKLIHKVCHMAMGYRLTHLEKCMRVNLKTVNDMDKATLKWKPEQYTKESLKIICQMAKERKHFQGIQCSKDKWKMVLEFQVFVLLEASHIEETSRITWNPLVLNIQSNTSTLETFIIIYFMAKANI